LGIGDWGLGIGDWAQSPIPNPQSPIPNPHFIIILRFYYKIKLKINLFIQNLNKIIYFYLKNMSEVSKKIFYFYRNYTEIDLVPQ
jgi:hypothetical protein